MNAAAIGGIGLSFGLLEVCMSILFVSLSLYVQLRSLDSGSDYWGHPMLLCLL